MIKIKALRFPRLLIAAGEPDSVIAGGGSVDGACAGHPRPLHATLHPEFVAALAALGDVDEQLIERDRPLDRSLFMGVADQDLEL